jgi:hypothetical protein
VSDILDSRSNKEDEYIIDGTDTRSGRAGKHVVRGMRIEESKGRDDGG